MVKEKMFIIHKYNYSTVTHNSRQINMQPTAKLPYRNLSREKKTGIKIFQGIKPAPKVAGIINGHPSPDTLQASQTLFFNLETVWLAAAGKS
jgi:hypothetical protein